MLQIRDLLKIYPGPVTALKGVSLDIPNGLFGLLGPNGAGKSTLMTIVAGLLQPTAGSITLDGTDIVTDPAVVRRALGYLPQEFGFYPELTGLKMLMLMLRLKGVDAPGGRRKLAEELLGDPLDDLDALEADHAYLTEGGVFTEDLIETWVSFKRENEILPMAQRPHPFEFELYYGV